MGLIVILLVVIIIFMFVRKRNKKSLSINEKTSSRQINKIIPEIKSIFNKFDPELLGDTPLNQAIKYYNHSIYYIYKGKLTSGTEYALLIGTSDKWINLITLTKAKVPTYEVYGYSIYEKRWSYGSRVLGAKEFRFIIENNNPEINKIMKELTPIRVEREKEKKKLIVEDEIIEKEFEKERKKEKAEIESVQKYFLELITDDFTTIRFDYNQNNSKMEGAIKEARNHFYDIDIINQTCACTDYTSDRYKYEKNDIRRLCPHLSKIIQQRGLIKRSKNKLDQFILETFEFGIFGIMKGKISDDLEFLIIIYNWSKNIFVVTPKTNIDGFQMIEWKNEDNEWVPARGGKKINDQIKPIINKYFPKNNFKYAFAK